MYSFGKESLKQLQGIAPEFVAVLKKAITDSPFDFSIVEGVRTAETQAAYYKKGRDKNGKIINKAAVVTMRDGVKLKSEHQVHTDGFGYAVDIYPYSKGIDYNDTAGRMKYIASHIKQTAKDMGINIEWGGSWTVEKQGLVDKPHFEYKP